MTTAPSRLDRLAARPNSGGGRKAAAALLLPSALTLAVAQWGISSASFWRDEAATLSATRRSFPDLLRMLGNTDAVHGAYYIGMWPVVHTFGISELAVRLPSALAMALAALCTSAIARRLVSRRAGLLAGLAFAALPMVSRYAQEARPYALATAMAALASYLLVRALEQPRPRWLAGYGLSIAALGLVNLFGLLLIAAHAIAVIQARSSGGVRLRTRAVRWLVAAGCGCAATAPLAVLAWRQRGQLSWLRKPAWADLYASATALAGTTPSLVILGVVAVAGAAGALYLARRRGPAGKAGPVWSRLFWLGAAWLVLPGAILFAVSSAIPVFLFRYLVFCLPAVALLAAAGLAVLDHVFPLILRRLWLTARRLPPGPGRLAAAAGRLARAAALARQPFRINIPNGLRPVTHRLSLLRRRLPSIPGTLSMVPAIAVVGALATVAIPVQTAVRLEMGHSDDIRKVAQVLRANEDPGDAVIYYDPGTRTDSFAYAYGFSRLRDISLRQSAAVAGNLGGAQAPADVLMRRLLTTTRVWIMEVGWAQHPAYAFIRRPQFLLAQVWSITDLKLLLYLHFAKR